MPTSVSVDDERHDTVPVREAVVSLDWTELEALGFGGLVAHCRKVGIRGIEMLEDDGYRCVAQLEVESHLDDALLAELRCVDRWELIAEKPGSYRYLLELTSTELPRSIADGYGELIGTSDVSLGEHGVTVTLLGTQKALRDVLRTVESTGVTPELRKLGEYSGDDTALDALTNRQREVIETAYRVGFYAVPRRASTEEVAEELGVDAATVSEHLQRAERNLLRRELPGS